MGQWWLPESPDTRVSGTLSISATGEAELVLIGALRSELEAGEATTDQSGNTRVVFSEETVTRSGVYPRIHGIAGSDAITLEDCLLTHRSGSIFGGLARERIHADQVFRGIHIESDSDYAYERINVWMDWLAYWVRDRSGIRENWRIIDDSGASPHLEYPALTLEPVAEEDFTGPDGITVSLGQTWAVTGDRITERRISQDFYFSVGSAELMTLTDLTEYVSELQDLVSMGTGRTAAFSRVSLIHPDTQVGNRGHKPIEYLAQWQALNPGGTRPLASHETCFTLAEMGGTEVVSRWLREAHKHRLALGRVMATRYSKSMYASDRLFNCASALEAYDRDKHGGNQYYVDRVRRCIATAGDPFSHLVGNTDEWAKELKNARNSVAHHKAQLHGSGSKHLFMSQSAYWLFVLCLLRDSEAPDTVFEKIRRSSQFRSLRTPLRQVMRR